MDTSDLRVTVMMRMVALMMLKTIRMVMICLLFAMIPNLVIDRSVQSHLPIVDVGAVLF